MLRPLALILALAAASTAAAAPVEVTVTHVKSAKGHVRVDICTAGEFLGDCAISGEAPAQRGDVVVNFPDVPRGAYAIQAYQDENDDHRVDRNRFGIPTEGFGFSNDAPFSLGPPKFHHAVFDVDADGARVTVRLHYLPH